MGTSCNTLINSFHCLLFIFYFLILSAAAQTCTKELAEDVCPQREGFDPDCEQRCLQLSPFRLSSACHLRSTGTLLSFFGIRSFSCRCEFPPQFCEAGGFDNAMKSTLSIQSLQQYSALTPRRNTPDCRSRSVSLQCLDDVRSSSCGWITSSGTDWYQATRISDNIPFASGEQPMGGFLSGVSAGAGILSIDSCPGLCSESDLTLSLKVWRSPWITAELCFRETDTLLCAPIRINNGKTVKEIMPQTANFSVSVRFSNTTVGDVVLVDDLSLSFIPCKKTITHDAEEEVRIEPVKRRKSQSSPQHMAVSRLCTVGECSPLLHSPSTETMCTGRAGILKCRTKCLSETGSASGRCVRERGSALERRCVCDVRRAPTTAQKYQLQPVTENNEIVEGTGFVDIPSTACLKGEGSCNEFCEATQPGSLGRCSPQRCRCIECEETMCDFERGQECGWSDLNTLSPQFNNVSVASKGPQDNRYGLTSLEPHTYSGLMRRGWLDGPLLLTVDVFPSHDFLVRICVDSLSRCQDQKVAGKAWNRVTAKVKVTRTDKLFLLLHNDSGVVKTAAIDNIIVRSGPCSILNKKKRKL